METLTKKTQTALLEKLAEEFTPLAKDLEDAGWSAWRIDEALGKVKKQRIKQFYEDRAVYRIGQRIGLVLDQLERQVTPDSHTETVFYGMLNEACIDFEFQVKIGNYRVDYLIEGFLIFEGDGPHHDQQVEYDEFRDRYLEKLGYTVMRLKWDLVALMPDMVIDIIKDETAKLRKGRKLKNG